MFTPFCRTFSVQPNPEPKSKENVNRCISRGEQGDGRDTRGKEMERRERGGDREEKETRQGTKVRLLMCNDYWLTLSVLWTACLRPAGILE